MPGNRDRYGCTRHWVVLLVRYIQGAHVRRNDRRLGGHLAADKHGGYGENARKHYGNGAIARAGDAGEHRHSSKLGITSGR